MITHRAYIVRPGWARIALIALASPFVGMIFALVVPTILGVSLLYGWSPHILTSLGENAGSLLFDGYLLGVSPAAIGTILYVWVSSAISSIGKHLGACVAIGAVSGGLGVQIPLALFPDKFFMFEPSVGFLSVVGGALALPVLAVPFGRKS